MSTEVKGSSGSESKALCRGRLILVDKNIQEKYPVSKYIALGCKQHSERENFSGLIFVSLSNKHHSAATVAE
jgi:hypothetical protein